MSDSVQPHRWQPTRLPHPWDSPGKNTVVGCHFLLQCMKVKSESEVAQSCQTLSDPMDCSLPGSSIHGIFQARVLEWGVMYPYCQLNKVQTPWHSGHFRRQVDLNVTEHCVMVVVQSLSHVQLFAPSWTAACQASLSFTISRSLLKSCPLSQWCSLTISSSAAPFPFAFNLSQQQGLFQRVGSCDGRHFLLTKWNCLSKVTETVAHDISSVQGWRVEKDKSERTEGPQNWKLQLTQWQKEGKKKQQSENRMLELRLKRHKNSRR